MAFFSKLTQFRRLSPQTKQRLMWGIPVSLMILIAIVVNVLAFMPAQKGEWVCRDGAWQKIGRPTQPAPTAACSSSSTTSPLSDELNKKTDSQPRTVIEEDPSPTPSPKSSPTPSTTPKASASPSVSPSPSTQPKTYVLNWSEGNFKVEIGKSYAIYALLKYDGEVVKDQSKIEYRWTIDNGAKANISSFTGCIQGVQEPCPADHLSVTGKEVGTATITAAAHWKENGNLIDDVPFALTVMAAETSPSPSPSPSSSPI